MHWSVAHSASPFWPQSESSFPRSARRKRCTSAKRPLSTSTLFLSPEQNRTDTKSELTIHIKYCAWPTTHPQLDTRCSRLCPDLCAHACSQMRLASHAATSFCVTSHVHIPPRLFVLAFMTAVCDCGRTELLIFFALFISPCTRELLG